jgi:hypothetical protein
MEVNSPTPGTDAAGASGFTLSGVYRNAHAVLGQSKDLGNALKNLTNFYLLR